MSEPRIISERLPEAPGVLYLTFHNPDAFNSVTVEMREELIHQFLEAEKNPDIRVIVLQGHGDRCFCSGLSMDMLVDMNSLEDRYVQWDVGKRCREAMENSTKIVVAAVKGSCAGNGLEFVLCCDLVYCADNTKFVLPEFNIGLTPAAAVLFPFISTFLIIALWKWFSSATVCIPMRQSTMASSTISSPLTILTKR